MADLLQRSSAWLENQRVKHMTRMVTYQRGSDAVEVPATIGQTVFELNDRAGAVLRTESRDYLILAEDLVLSGIAVTPRRGDRIRESTGTVTQVYEVLAPGDEPCWRYSDPYRQTLRIHTKHFDTENE